MYGQDPISDPVIGIIFQAGPGVGSDHALRCATLAHALKAQGAQIVALCFGQLTPALKERLEEVCERVSVDMMPPIAYTAALAKPLEGAQVLVFDGHDLGSFVELCAKDRFPITVIDDNKEVPVLDAHVVINPNIHADLFGYQYLTEAGLFLGKSHALIRPELLGISRERNLERTETLLVSFDREDSQGLTLATAQELADNSWPEHCIFSLDPNHRDYGELETIIANSQGRFSHIDGTTVEALTQCDLAVISADGQLLEFGYLGIPTVAVFTEESQLFRANRASSEGIAIALDLRDPGGVDNLITTVEELAADIDKRRVLSQTGIDAVDGQGAQRCAKAVLSTLNLVPRR